MGKGRTAWTWPGAVVVGVAVIAAACSSGGSASNSTTTTVSSSSTASSGTTTGTSPGVSKTQINIGAISSKTGQLAGYFDGIAPGMIAYFNTLNANGGINGRHIVLTNNLDDGGSPTQFIQDAHTLIDQDHVFAIGVASAWFSPNYFVTTKTPTYGYNVSANWQGAPNLYAVGGSTQVYANGYSSLAYFIKKVAAKSVAFISYGPSIASSYDACSSYATGMKQAGFNVVLADVGAQLGGSYSSDVQRLQQSGAQLVVTCMQASDNITLTRDIHQYGLKIKQFWLNGYDQALLDQYGSLMEGVYVDNVGGVPFQAGDTSRYGNTYPGMLAYLAAMKKYEPNFVYNGVAFQGWQSAALIAAGVKAAGKNPTQASVIAATNKITNFTANGVSAPVDWAVSHTGTTWPDCSAYIQVQGGKYVPVFGQGKQVFVCVNKNPKNPVPVTPAPGTPGA
jgi:ABC-type branched-subunit amino acid transport system substrate-binding protein